MTSISSGRAHDYGFANLIEPGSVTADHVVKAIASFERTIIAGNSPFDCWYFGGEEGAISDQAKRGFEIFLREGRCVSCHTIDQNFALFTDHKFHNLNVGFQRVADDAVEQV